MKSTRPTGFTFMLQPCECYISVNFHSFTQNLFTCKVGNLVFIICSLLVRMDYVTDKLKGE